MSCADDLLAHQSSAGFEHVAAIQRTESICLALGGDARDFRLHVFVGHNDASVDKVSNLTVLVCLAFLLQNESRVHGAPRVLTLMLGLFLRVTFSKLYMESVAGW